MHICSDCGRTFEEPVKNREQIGEFWGTPAYSDFYTCPYCGSEAVDEARECPFCGTAIQSDEDLCEGCIEIISCTVSDAIRKLEDRLHTTYDKALEAFTEEIERRN